MNTLDKVYNLTIDIKNIDVKYNSYAKFFDDDRETSVIRIKLLNDKTPMNLENCIVEAYFILADNTYHNEACKIINSSEGVVELQLCQKCLVKGENIVRLSILKDNEISNTPVITYEVRKGLYSDNPSFNDDPLTPILSQMLLDIKVTKVNQIELQERYEKSLPKIEGKIKEVDNKISEIDKSKSDMTTTVSNKIEEVENRFNTLTSSQQQDAEVIDARDGEVSLKARLDNFDSQLEHITSVNKINVLNPPTELTPCKIDGVTDDYDSLINIIKYCKENNCSGLILPYTGSKMILSNTVTIDFSNFEIDIYCDIQFTFTTPKQGIEIKGKSASNRIKNIKINGNGIKIDGNGRNIQDYIYSLSDNNYNVLYVWGVDDLYITGVKCENGLVTGCGVAGCRNYVIENCEFNNSIHDNGFQSINNPYGSGVCFSDDDIETQTNGYIKNCKAHNNEDFGFTSWQSAYVTFEDCISYENGNDGLNFGNGGGYSAEYGSLTPRIDCNVKFLNCKSINNKGYGFYIDMDGVYLDSQCVSNGTLLPLTTDKIERYGNGVTILSSVKNITIQGQFNNNARNGIRYLSQAGDENAINNLYINAKCEGNTQTGLLLKGVNSVKVEGQYNNNGNIGVRIDNESSYNLKNGTIDLKNIEINENSNVGLVVKGVDTTLIKRFVISSNCMNTGVNNISLENIENLFCTDGESRKGKSLNLTLAFNTKDSVVNNLIFNVDTYGLNNYDKSQVKRGLSEKVFLLEEGDNLNQVIAKINTLITRLRYARVIDDIDK